ncbi:MAG: hypothetical protein WBV93_10735 [Anaerobacillus sp.]
MQSYLTKVTFVGTILSVVLLITLILDPFREWIFIFLTELNVDYSKMGNNPFTYLLVAFILFFVLSLISFSEKTRFYLNVLCASVNVMGLLVVGFIVFIGSVL